MTMRWAMAGLITTLVLTGCVSKHGGVTSQAQNASSNPAIASSGTRTSDVLFSEDFERYADPAAFLAVWRVDGVPASALDIAFGNGSKQSVKLQQPDSNGQGATNRFYYDLPHSVTPSDAAPVEFSFDLFFDPADAANHWAHTWQTVDIRGYTGGKYKAGDVTGIVSMGTAGISSNPWSVDYYQCRVLKAGDTNLFNQYYTLHGTPDSPTRSAGWHTFKAVIGATYTEVSVDGKLADRIGTGVSQPLNTIILGSGVGSGGNTTWCDNVSVRQLSSGR